MRGHLLTGSARIDYFVGEGEGAVRAAREAGTVAVDIETAGLGVDASTIHSVQIATTELAHVLDPESDRQAIVDALRGAQRLIFHNSPFDVPILVQAGLMDRCDVGEVWDTLIASRMANPSDIGGHDLATAYRRHGIREVGDKKALHEKWRKSTGKSKADMFRRLGVWSEPFVQYAANDAVMTARLAEVLPMAMRRHTRDHPFPSSGMADNLLEREQTINRMMLARTCAGIEIDLDVVDELKEELNRASWEADEVLRRYGVDVGMSAPKVKEAVMDTLDQLGTIPKGYRRLQSGRASADAKDRQRLVHPMLDALETRSKAERFVADYANKMIKMADDDGRIHPLVDVAKAVTGRMSMKEPPLHQYPESVRRMMRFDTPAVSMDWSSIEPALFANLAGETALIEAYEGGGDLYLPVAEAAGVERKVAKVILLAQFYGQGAPRLAGSLGVTEDEARELVGRVMGPLKSIRGAIRGIREVGNMFGKVQTLSGRICPIPPDVKTGNRLFMGYLGVNYVVQGGAYDLLAEALCEMHRCGLDDALYVAVHDELVVAADAAADVERIMRTPPPALIEATGRVPVLRVGRSELGRNWLEKEH